MRVLKRFARDIRKKLPVDPIQKAPAQLEKAVKNEAYEEAARLRDEIKRREPPRRSAARRRQEVQ